MRGLMKSKSDGNVVNYVLPFNQIKNYPELFRTLEKNQNLEFKLILTSLEEAFLNFSSVEK